MHSRLARHDPVRREATAAGATRANTRPTAPGEPEEAPLAVVELVGILPDEHWDVRAALTDALSERIGREVGKR